MSHNSKNLYKCQFCEQNIYEQEKENHYEGCDKVASFISDHLCEFCEKFFDTQGHLHKHIENIHRKSNSKQHPNESVEKKSLEEGKSLILELVENFNEDDALKFLNWIKEEGMETLHRIVLRSIVQNQDHHKIVELKYENDLANESVEKKSLKEGKSLILELIENFNEDDALKFLNWIKEEGMETLHRIVLRSIVQNQDHHKIVELKYENDLANIGITEDFSMDESMDIGSNDLQSHTIEKSNQVEFLKYYHIQEEHTCYYCGESFSEQDTFEGHICAIPEGHKDHKCESCGKSFSSGRNLRQHIHTVHQLIIETISSDTNAKTFLCHICDKEYNIYFQLKQHITKVHDEKKSNNFHINIDNDQKLDENKSTNKNDTTSISNANDLKEHVQVLADHKDHKCTFCDKSFSRAGHLKGHIQAVHEGLKNHKCKSCGKLFSRAENLKKHIHTVHEGHKDYKCEDCGKLFVNAGCLKKHQHIVHDGHKDHKCKNCGKSFSDAGYLKKHIHTVHDGHKDYKCESCGKSFSQAGDLKRHIYTIHEDHKDYKCESCGKSFTEEGSLKRHIHTVHEGHKDYICDSCGKTFSRSEDLKKHTHRVHEH